MKAVFKTSTISSPLEMFSGVGINTYGSEPKKLAIDSIIIVSRKHTTVDVYIEANDLATNTKTKRHLAYKMDVVPGEILQIIEKPVSCTTEYSLFIDKDAEDGSDVDVYVEYQEVDDPNFVSAYSV